MDILVHFNNPVNFVGFLLTLQVCRELCERVNWNGDWKFPSYTYIQQAIVRSHKFPNRNAVVRAEPSEDGFIMAILIHTPQSNEMTPIGRFHIDESRNGRRPVEMFNLIIMSDVFQAWFKDEFDCNLPLPMYKTNREPRQLFEPPNSIVHQLDIELDDADEEEEEEEEDEGITIEDLHAVAVTNTTDLQTVRNDINILRTGLNNVTQDMRKLTKLMTSMHLCMQSMQGMMQHMVEYEAHADNVASESKLAEAVACLSDAELPESDNKYM